MNDEMTRTPEDSMDLIKDPTLQYAMTVVVPVEDDKVAPLRSLLETISEQTVDRMRGGNSSTVLVPFHEVESLHYGRFLLVEKSSTHGDPALLELSTNYDGPPGQSQWDEKRARADHLHELVDKTHNGLAQVFAHCQGYAGGSGKDHLREFIARDEHQIRTQTFYTGSSGRSRQQILGEWKLRGEIEAAADRVATQQNTDPERVREKIIEELKEANVAIPPPFPQQPDGKPKVTAIAVLLVLLVLGMFVGVLPWLASRISGGMLPFGILALGGLLLLVLVLFALYRTLRSRKKCDPVDSPRHDKATTDHTAYASAGENLFMQNQLTHLVDVKDGLFRLMVIKFVFFALQLLATNVYTRGKLGNIPSIHFARWVFLGKKRRVLFFSNFDNSWQSYLGDFVDQASSGLTAVWSNTKGYPRTENLVNAGSRNSTSFLAWTRAHQLPTDVWYSAYPALSVKNVNDNTRLRRGIADTHCMPATDWLRSLAGEDLEPQAPPEKRDLPPPPVELPVHDIQGIILKGYGFLAHASFLMLRVTEAKAARKWIAALTVTPASKASKHGYGEDERAGLCFVNVAFTHPGLDALGLDAALLDSFPIEFVRGSHDPARSRILGDVPRQLGLGQWRAARPRPLDALLPRGSRDRGAATALRVRGRGKRPRARDRPSWWQAPRTKGALRLS